MPLWKSASGLIWRSFAESDVEAPISKKQARAPTIECIMETHNAATEYAAHQQFTTETHDAAEHFQCFICLELVYKPIVHACGHLFCFWCVHRAMIGICKNLCPLCRRPYMHFPRICEQLHFVLLKAAHDKYLIRTKEVLEEEAKGCVFSPELHPVTRIRLETPTPSEEVSSTDTSNSASTLSNSSTSSSGDDHPSPSNDPALTKDPSLSFKGKAAMPDKRETIQEPPDTSNIVTVADLACFHCNNLLYRPVVLNCGHMFCERCVEVGDKDSVTCPSCKADHPGVFPQVCLELLHYIERIFPLEYAQRSLQVAPLQRPSLPPSDPEDSIRPIRKQLPGPVHRDVGCDGCGMFPVVGKRFMCQDCPKAIGFDLCGKCYDSGILLGRFNQGHTSEHRMVEVRLCKRASSFARRFLDVVATRSLNNMDAIANDYNDTEALQVLLLQQHSVDGSNGASGSETMAQAISGAAPLVVVEEDVEAPIENYVLQDGDGDGDGDEHLHDGFLHNGGGDDGESDGQDDEEFQAFSRDDEDIDFFRVVFHS